MHDLKETPLVQGTLGVRTNPLRVSVTGDDTSGTANASINFNGASKEVALKYEVKDGKLVAMGQIDLQSDFDAKEAFDKFAADKVIQGLHGKKTWPQVDVGFEVPVK